MLHSGSFEQIKVAAILSAPGERPFKRVKAPEPNAFHMMCPGKLPKGSALMNAGI